MVFDSPQFERLPLDVLHQVLLSVDSTSDLHNLIRASPVIYHYYLRRPTFWLYHSLKRELGLGIVDACSVQLFSAADFRPSRTKDNVRQFLDTYDLQRREHHSRQSILLQKNQIIPAVAFHSKIIKPLVRPFTAWAQTHNDSLTTPAQISTTETRRIQRALYRYHLFCNLFGADVQSRRHIGTNDERLQWFLHNLEPWGIEEILCINQFIQDKYESVLDDVTWDLHPDNPERAVVRGNLFIPQGADSTELFGNSYIIGMSSLGLTVLSSIFEAQDHPALVDLMSQHITATDGDWLFEATDIHIQHNRRVWFYTDGDEAQDLKEPMPFEGDGEHLPPLAWVIIWKETYSNLYGAYMKGSFREWGYVMWDAGRLISSGIASTLKTEWEDFCAENE